jgi:hypothetical protein
MASPRIHHARHLGTIFSRLLSSARPLLGTPVRRRDHADRPGSSAASLLEASRDRPGPGASRVSRLDPPPSSQASVRSASHGILSVLEHGRRARQRSTAERGRPGERERERESERHRQGAQLARMISRRWKAGDVYAPHDLSASEMRKWRRRGAPAADVFDVLALRPEREWKVSGADGPAAADADRTLRC